MEFFSLTDVGLVRDKNQDSYMTVYNAYGDFMALVCDGVGGNRAGEVASGESIKYFLDQFSQSGPFDNEKDVVNFLYHSFKAVNRHIFKLASSSTLYRGMGTTLSGIFIGQAGIFTINIGDSRVYGFKDQRIFRLTEDHSLVNELLKSGQITYEESLNHPKRHYLMKAVGIWEDVSADIAKVPPMTYYLVSSDGLHAYVSDEEINAIMIDEDLNILQKTKHLMQAALLKGGKDNITIVIIKR